MTTLSKTIAVVVAAVDSCSEVESLTRFSAELQGRGEVILVAGRCGDIASGLDAVRVVRTSEDLLVPELWRDGLASTIAEYVVFSTTAMVPARGWLDALLAQIEQTGAAAVGGSIKPGKSLNALDRAVYLLRYVNYLRPVIASNHPEPAGENAIYRRDRLNKIGLSFEQGFWESDVHRALRADRQALSMTDQGALTFEGGSRLSRMVVQRFRHGRRYGASRVVSLGKSERFARIAAAPLVPALLLSRIARTLRAKGESFKPWMSAVPALSLLATIWAAGEAWGMVTGMRQGVSTAVAPSMSYGFDQ